MVIACVCADFLTFGDWNRFLELMDSQVTDFVDEIGDKKIAVEAAKNVRRFTKVFNWCPGSEREPDP